MNNFINCIKSQSRNPKTTVATGTGNDKSREGSDII